MRRLLRSIAYIVLAPLIRFMLRWFRHDDPWEPLDPRRIPPKHYGSGSTKPFEWYLEGESTVAVSTLDEIVSWLLECNYASDVDLFNEPDFWQHPRTFEYLRRGDCEDHALWAWRKLRDLGIEAELIAGQWNQGEVPGGHVWVVFEQDGEQWLFETVPKAPDAIIARLDDVKTRYRPELAISGSLRSRAYTGYLHALHERLDRAAQRRRDRIWALFGRSTSREAA